MAGHRAHGSCPLRPARSPRSSSRGGRSFPINDALTSLDASRFTFALPSGHMDPARSAFAKSRSPERATTSRQVIHRADQMGHLFFRGYIHEGTFFSLRILPPPF